MIYLRSAKAERSWKIIELPHYITFCNRSALAERIIKVASQTSLIIKPHEYGYKRRMSGKAPPVKMKRNI